MFAGLALTRPPDHLEGFLSRWLQQVETNLYVGCVSPRVVERIKEKLVEHLDGVVRSSSRPAVVENADTTSGTTARAGCGSLTWTDG